MSSLKLEEEPVLVEELQIPDDEFLPEPWKYLIQKLVNTVDTLTNKIKSQQETNKTKTNEIITLQKQVSNLTKEVETSRQWETVVYAELQKINTHNVEVAERMSQLQTYWNDMNTTEQIADETNTNSEHVGKNSIKASQAVIYGDSAVSKKVHQRKRLKLEKGNSKSLINGLSVTSNSVSNFTPDSLSEPVVESQAKSDEHDVSPSSPDVEMVPNEVAVHHRVDQTGSIEIEEGKSIAETLAEAAESVVQNSGFTYDETSGFYYDWNSKMYYDPSTKLYYDHDNGIYYSYDPDRKSYLFHSQIKVAVETTEENMDKNDSNQLSDGEINSDTDETVCTDPCVRMIVVVSEALDIGSLYIVTCTGGSIGKNTCNLIQINEDSVSKIHAKILYDSSLKTFFIQDCQTANGTFINNERIADARTQSDPIEITHRDFLKIGSSTFSLHIHIGNDTCEECEPGNIQAILAKTKADQESNKITDLNAQRKQELKTLRNRYGIKPGYLPKSLIESIPDRAEKRRVNVGSEPYENKLKPPVKASVHEEIPQNNKGHKMLAKMGWKSGEGLGKSKSGITQPITVNVLEKKKGLGTGMKTSLDNVVSKNQRKIWEKTKERYDKIDKT